MSRQNADLLSIQSFKAAILSKLFPCEAGLLLRLLRLMVVLFIRICRSRRNLLLENLALRQQLAVLKERNPHPLVPASAKLSWTILRQLWPGWNSVLILVQPETVVRWHRNGFKAYWVWLSRPPYRPGRKCVTRELCKLISHMVAENGGM